MALFPVWEKLPVFPIVRLTVAHGLPAARAARLFGKFVL
jgi:hypothetical protein